MPLRLSKLRGPFFMSKQRKKGRYSDAPGSLPDSGQHVSVGDPIETEKLAFHWSAIKRRIVSLVIIGYLGVLLVGPLSNPVASPYLSGPIAGKVSPVHRALFLGHGYRFFGPDPGPSHLLVYQGERSDKTKFEGVFPDQKEQWPRLLYHRWFMLSETVFAENSNLPSPQQFQNRMDSYEARINECNILGRLNLSRELQAEREIEAEQYEVSRERAKLLGNAISRELMKRHNGSSIKLFIQVRQIPLAEEVASGLKLDDESLLSELLPIGAADEQGFTILSPAEVEISREQLPSDDSAEVSK